MLENNSSVSHYSCSMTWYVVHAFFWFIQKKKKKKKIGCSYRICLCVKIIEYRQGLLQNMNVAICCWNVKVSNIYTINGKLRLKRMTQIIK